MSKRATETVKAVTRLDFKEAISCLFTSPDNNLIKFAITNEQIREFYAEHIEPFIGSALTVKIKREVRNNIGNYLDKFELELQDRLEKTLAKYSSSCGRKTIILSASVMSAITRVAQDSFRSLMYETIETAVNQREESIRKEFEAREERLKNSIDLAIEQRVVEFYKIKAVKEVQSALDRITKEL